MGGGPVKLGVNPISADEMYLFVNENLPERIRVTDEELVPKLREMMLPFTDPLLQTITESISADSLVMFRPMDNMMLPLPWHRGRIVFIGDAAHATTPHLAAGAGIGLEDAIVLAEELVAGETLERAFTAFGERRFERCRMVVENSAALGRLEMDPTQKEAFASLQAESNRLLAEPV